MRYVSFTMQEDRTSSNWLRRFADTKKRSSN